jgi:hypothetical protein
MNLEVLLEETVDYANMLIEVAIMQESVIGKYLSSLRKLDHVIAPKEGFETQL